jgi:hypothetical protein
MRFLVVPFWIFIGWSIHRLELLNSESYKAIGQGLTIIGAIALFIYFSKWRDKTIRAKNDHEEKLWAKAGQVGNLHTWRKQNRSIWQKFWFWAFFIQ